MKIDSTATLDFNRLGCSVAEDGTCGCLDVAGTLDLDGLVIVGENMASKKSGRGLTIATATAFTGQPATVSVAGESVSVGRGKVRIGAPGLMLLAR